MRSNRVSLFRAGLCLAVAGCGFPPPADLPSDSAGDASSGDDAGGGDAAGSDAGVDGMTDPRGTVRVTVVDPAGGGAPAVGVTVVFIDPDGTVVKTTSTNSSGKTEADVLPGASVTTVIASASRFRMRTMLGVQPGDDLVIGPRTIDTSGSGQFTLSWPDAPNHATTFTVYGPCGLIGTTTFVPPGMGSTAPTTLAFPVQNGCRPDPSEFLVWARGQAGLSLHFNVNENIPFSAGRNFTMSNLWHGGLTFSASYTNVPVMSTITTDRVVPDGGRSDPSSQMAAEPTTFSFSGPRGISARVVSRFVLISGAKQVVRQRVPGDSSTYGMNVGETLLAWLAAPTFDAATQQFRVVKTAAGSSPAPTPDLFEVEAAWERGTTEYVWEVFGPDATTIQLPVLPAAAGAALNPTASDAVRAHAISYEAETFDGYDAARINAGVALTDTFEPTRSAAERVRVSHSPVPPSPPIE
jgi:hypothetical protein